MKKAVFTFITLITAVLTGFAGGLLTNSNQSAQYVRMLSRNASTDIDAVYFNPAGLIQLSEGWHFSLNNQSIFQDKMVESRYPGLNQNDYLGKVKAPVFPSAFAVYRKENWAFSLGFGPNAGGGSADFATGLPSFEIPIASVVPQLAALSKFGYPVTGYDAKIAFEGSSIFWGIQAGATYKLSDRFSVYGGVRYLPSTNTYTGSIKNVQFKVSGTLQPAPEFLSTVGNYVKTTVAGTAAATATSLQQIIDGGYGSLTLAQAISDANTRTALLNGLISLGVTSAAANAMTITQAQAAFTAGAEALVTQGNGLIAAGQSLQNKEVDTKQTGAGWTPMVGVQFSPAENLNIAARYEMKTKLELTNDTPVDDIGLFPHKGKSRSDIPAVLALGAGYKPVEWFETQLSYTLYFDKNVEWGNNVRDLAVWKSVNASKIRKREIDHNYYELALGMQFNLSEKLALSLGGMTSQPGISASYQSDFSYSNPSVTFGCGLQWKITNQLTLDAGYLNTTYKDEKISYGYPNGGQYTDVLGKTTTSYAVGLSYSIFK